MSWSVPLRDAFCLDYVLEDASGLKGGDVAGGVLVPILVELVLG
jgi:hypothetical protein